MKVLIVSQYFYPENFRINDLAHGFKELGHEVTVLTGIPNYPQGQFFEGYSYFKPREEIWNGIKIIRCLLTPRRDSRFIYLILNYLSYALFASIAVLTRLKGKYDVIFVFEISPITVGIPAIVAKYVKKAPIFFWVLDLWPESVIATTKLKSKLIVNLLTCLTRTIYKHCDKVLVQSKGFYQHAQKMGVSDAQLRFFPNWAEDLYQPLSKNKFIEATLPKGFRVMFAGNIGSAQDFGSILNAAEALKENFYIQWVIVGDGKEKNWVLNEVKLRGLGRTFHLVGQHPIESMPHFFASADVMLVSLKDDEIFSSTIPGKIPSYFACAKPVLGMLNGEGANIINEAGAGLTCDAGDSKGLVEIVLKISQLSSHELESLGNNGLRYYQQTFDRASLFKKLEEEMSELATK